VAKRDAPREGGDGAYLGLRIILFWIPVFLFVLIIYTKPTLLWCKFILGLLLLAFHVFFYFVLIFNSALAKRRNILRLSMGEMRGAIAIILTIAFISTLFLDLTGFMEATGYTNYFVYGIYGAIISFYFGLRTVEKKKIESLIKKGDAIEILKTRYALGELSETEFESMKKQL